MRSAAILSIAVTAALSGCAISGPSVEWREIQNQWLERAHRPPTVDDAFQQVLARAPSNGLGVARSIEPLPAEPKHVLGMADLLDSLAVSFALPEPGPDAQQPRPTQDPKHPATFQPRKDILTRYGKAAVTPESRFYRIILDQRMPAGPINGPRSFRNAWQPLVATFDYGVGDVMVRADGTLLNDRADAAFARVRIDAGTGAALHAEWWGSDSELFAGMLMDAGDEDKEANAELGGADVFPHLRFDNTIGDWSIPVRFGLFADWHQLDHQQARVEREWLSFGLRLVIEPTWKLLDRGDTSLHLFTRVGVDAGAAWFSEEFRNGDDRDSLPRWGGEIGAGFRGEFGSWHMELGYRLNHTMYGESQGDLLGSPGRTELQRQQLFFGLGINY